MQPLLLKGALPFPLLVSFFFMKFCFSLLASMVHGFVNLLPMVSLKNFNSILLNFDQYIFNLKNPTKRNYKLQTLFSACDVVQCGATVCEKMLDPTRVSCNQL